MSWVVLNILNIFINSLENEFPYSRSKEGWGLTHSETELIKSDGTSKIWFLDPSTQYDQSNWLYCVFGKCPW